MIRVLIVDDSAVVRKVLTKELSQFNDIEVVGSAVDPYVAREKIIQLRPDVITLDIEMPRMDGLSFLEKLMRSYPLPVIVVSSLASENSENAFTALALGAIDVIAKPGSQFSTPDIQGQLVRAIRTAAKARVIAIKEKPANGHGNFSLTGIQTTHKIIAIGASTGGPPAIEKVLTQFPSDSPGTVVVQHMPRGFTASFAKRLNQVCKIEVREAVDGDAVVPGVALIAPGNVHMILNRSGANHKVRLKNGPAVHFQRPSVDVLFQSAAKMAGVNAVGVLLTGMGGDGAAGLLAMRELGAKTIAQDEESCVVFGMPKAAINIGAADYIVSIDQIPQKIFDLLGYKSRRSSDSESPHS